jgi:catechol 2,3-dioxygenase-like lactoylglutathione lyase family enzyme
MKRFHVHVAVPDLKESIRFYSAMFGADPSVVKPDYAKWMLEDPRVNFAISHRPGAAGLDHLGIQAENESELTEIAQRLKAAEHSVFEQSNASCCYAQGDKAWVADPTGLSWETFHSTGEITTYGEDRAKSAPRVSSAINVQSGPRCAPNAMAPSKDANPMSVAAKGCCS